MEFIWKFIARQMARPAVANWLIERAMRTPYSNIEKDGVMYMWRWWLFNPYPDTGASGKDRKRWQFPISIRIHHIVEPDQDRDMHDHPWNARTIILRGSYSEVRPLRDPTLQYLLRNLSDRHHYTRSAGETAKLKFGEYHRITSISDGGVYTMFVTGRYRGTWGFNVDGVKVPWREYLGL